MTHEEFLKKLYDLKDEAQSAKEDYLHCLEEMKKSKVIWAISKRKLKEHKEDYELIKKRG